MSKPTEYLDDFDTDIDCGEPAAAVVIVWIVIIGLVVAVLIGAAILFALAGVGQ